MATVRPRPAEPVHGGSASTTPTGSSPYSGDDLRRRMILSARSPFPTMRVGARRWCCRRSARWMAARTIRPTGISTAALIQILSTVPEVSPGTRENSIALSSTIDATATVVSIGPTSSRKFRLSRRRYACRVARSPTTRGTYSAVSQTGGMLSCAFAAHPTPTAVAAAAVRTSMETVTIVLSGSKRISWENVLRFSGSGPPGSRAPGASPTSDTRALRRRPGP